MTTEEGSPLVCWLFFHWDACAGLSCVKQLVGLRVREGWGSWAQRGWCGQPADGPGQGPARTDGVLDPSGLGVGEEVVNVGDFFEEEPLVLQRPETALA